MKARKQQERGPTWEHVFLWAVDWEKVMLPEDCRMLTLHVMSSHKEITDALLREIRGTLRAWTAKDRLLDTDADFRILGLRPVDREAYIVRLAGAEG
ncbi:MAG: hypothetical protein ABSA52_21705 [Candidatus Binatia bacterium]|jgi:hypothetical protein